MIVEARPIESIDWSDREYDGFVCALGYEERARYIAETRVIKSTVKTAIGFKDRQVMSYLENRVWFHENAFRVQEVSDDEVDAWIASELSLIAEDIERPVYVCVDVSSLNRYRIAAVFNAIGYLVDIGRPVELDVLYAVAKAGEESGGAPVVRTGPIHPQFAGWVMDPDAPAAAIIGLGYEREKAISVIEYLEPSAVFAFRTSVDDSSYYEKVQSANRMLWEYVEPDHIIEYSLQNLQSCFADLELLVHGLLRSYRPIIVPFGPKVFTAISLGVAQLHAPSVSVWRSSYGIFEEAMNRQATGTILGIRFVYSRDGSD